MFDHCKKGIVVACAVALLGTTLGNTASHASTVMASQAVPMARKSVAGHEDQSHLLKLLKLVPEVQHSGYYNTGSIAGSRIGDLYADYVGYYPLNINGKILQQTVPGRMYVNWNQRIETLWARKIAMSPEHKTIVTDTGDLLVAEYKRLDPGRMTLKEYQALADNETRLVRRSLNWGSLCASYKLDSRRCTLLLRAYGSVDGRTIIAYGKTEICPTSGRFCDTFLDFILRNAGRRYLESIPALHDTLTSFGTFQFTPKAVFDIGSKGPIGGASKVNRQLPRALQVPASMALFRQDHHLRAASLFAVANLAAFIRGLDGRHLMVLERVAYSRRLDLAQFIATAHNKPQAAYRAGARWLESKAVLSYVDGCAKASRLYATKTKKNYLYLPAGGTRALAR